MNEDLERVVKQLDYLVEQGTELNPPDPILGVVHYLIREKVKGNPGHSVTCPVARYVMRETGIRVGISRSSVAVVGHEESAGTPPAIGQFIGLFDAGMIPELDEAALAPRPTVF